MVAQNHHLEGLLSRCKTGEVVHTNKRFFIVVTTFSGVSHYIRYVWAWFDEPPEHLDPDADEVDLIE